MEFSVVARRGKRWLAESRATASLGLPLILTNLAQTAFTATDISFIAKLGPETLAAAALSVSLYHAMTLFGVGLVSATMPLLAKAIGYSAEPGQQIRATVRHALWSALIICLPIWLVAWNADAVFMLFGQPPERALQAAAFMHTMQWALLPFLFYIVLRSFLSAMEKPMWALLICCGGIGINALLGWSLVFGHMGMPTLGLSGAGMANSATSMLMFVALAAIVATDRRYRAYCLFSGLWQLEWVQLARFWRLGLPISVIFMLETSIFYAAAMMMGVIGANALAAHAVVMQIASIGFMVPLGLGQAATIRVGKAHGAGNPEGIRLAGWTAYWLAIGFMCITASAMLLAPRTLLSPFIDVQAAGNAAAVGLATTFLALAALFQLADGAQGVCTGMLRGVHDTRIPMVLALLGYWGIGLPAAALLGFVAGLGGTGIWLGLALSLLIVAILMTWRWIRITAIPVGRLRT